MTNKKLADQLLVMANADQAMREKALNDTSLLDQSLDRKHTNILKKMVEKHGWLTISLVGEEASNAAWLIVQHADHDQEFQENCLHTMKQLGKDEVSSSNIAYLEDRVRLAQGKPQLYGTQFITLGSTFRPRKIWDRSNLNKRRKAMGLSSFEDYEKLMLRTYFRLQ